MEGIARQGEQRLTVLQQDDPLAGNRSRPLPMFLDGEGANPDGMLEEAQDEHGAQDATHLVFQGCHTHLSRLNSLDQPVSEVRRSWHLLV